MKVTVHSVEDQLNVNNETFGLNDWGYELAMDFLNHNQEYRGGERYEYFGTDLDIDFKWDMTPEQYEIIKRPPKEWTPNNYLGAVFFGNCKLEFILAQDNGDSYVYCNMFVKGREGYDIMEDGTPYADYEGFAAKFDSDLPKRRTFDAFPRKIEEDIPDVLNEYHQLIEDAIAQTNPDAWYPYEGHEPITITRRA